MDELRTPTGVVLSATAVIGFFMAAAHWAPLLIVTLPLIAATLLVPPIARRSDVWALFAVIWAVAAIVRRREMEDHVYLYMAWLVAIALALLATDGFVATAGTHARRLIAVVFAFATFWKLFFGEFITGTALWTLGLFDDRLTPLMRLMGIDSKATADAQREMSSLLAGDISSVDIDVSGYSNLALIAVSIGTLLLEAFIAISHAASDHSRIARYRVWALVVFGLVTYSVVPVFTFAMLLAVMSATTANFDRRSVLALGFMVAVAFVRFLTL